MRRMEDPVRAYLEGREAAMLASIERLVAVNSYTDNRDGGLRTGELLAAELASIPGVSVRVVPSTRYADHLVACTDAASTSAEGCVAIVGHLDTVFPAGTFEGFARDGALARGPGVLDMKGGLVVAIEALRALAAAGTLARAKVRFVIVSDEEVGSPESQPLLRRELAGASAALVLEAGRAADAIITARKGTGSAKVTAHGKAAHAGNAHDKGANAIWALARFVDRAQSLTDYARGVTVNVGSITGGQSKNTVPDLASSVLDLRFERIADGEATLAALHEDRAGRAPRADAARAHAGQRRALPRVRRACACRRARRRRGAPARWRLRCEHHGGDGDPVDRRPRPARLGLPHEGRAHRGRHARAQGGCDGRLPGRARIARDALTRPDESLSPRRPGRH
jgi:glutamate carboxypeptidase